MNLPVEVLEAVNKGKCLLFVGPVFSHEAAEEAGSSYPDGKTLAKALGWNKARRIMGVRTQKKIIVPSPMDGATKFEAEHGREKLCSEIRSMVGVENVSPLESHKTALKRFPLIFTTNVDNLLERAGEEMGGKPTVCLRNDEVPSPDPAKERVVYKLWGDLDSPESLVLTQADHQRLDFSKDIRRQMRTLIRRNVVFFVGYRPDEENFERLWSDLTTCYGGELPRCHMAVAQGKINDYLWQKWVWRGLLMFTADPGECMEELERRIDKG